MATDTSEIAKAMSGAIFIAMPMSVMIAVSGNIVYSSGIVTGFGFIAVFGAVLEIFGFLGIAASAYILLKSIGQLRRDKEEIK